MSHWLCIWAMKHERTKCENHRNTRAIKFVLSRFRRVFLRRDFSFGIFFMIGTLFTYTRMAKKRKLSNCLLHSRYVSLSDICPMRMPSNFSKCSDNTLKISALTNAHWRNLLLCPTSSSCPARETFPFGKVYYRDTV